MPTTETNNDFHQVDEAVEDLIGTSPNWLLKSGISVLAIVVTSLMILTGYIKYPEKISATGTMSSDSPPIEHITKTDGIIDTILVRNNSTVKKGTPIIYIQNTTNLKDLQLLKIFINDYENQTVQTHYKNLKFPIGLKLGELQSEYAALETAYIEFKNRLEYSTIHSKVSALESEIDKLKELNRAILIQREIENSILNIKKKDYTRNQKLISEKVISEIDIEKSESEFLNQNKLYSSLENSIIENRIRTDQIKYEIFRLKEEDSFNKSSLTLKINEIISRLKLSITAWEVKYFVKAEIGGTLLLQSSVIPSATIEKGQLVANIMQTQHQSCKFIIALLPGDGIGKVKVGSKAIVKVNGFPYKEYGTLVSYISNISKLPNYSKDGEFLYELKLPIEDTIITNYNKKIQFEPKREVNLDIITEDKSLLEHILNDFREILKK